MTQKVIIIGGIGSGSVIAEQLKMPTKEDIMRFQ